MNNKFRNMKVMPETIKRAKVEAAKRGLPLYQYIDSVITKESNKQKKNLRERDYDFF